LKLTPEEIQLFEHGKLVSESAYLADKCLLVPYDKTFEIPKSELVISTSIDTKPLIDFQNLNLFHDNLELLRLNCTETSLVLQLKFV